MSQHMLSVTTGSDVKMHSSSFALNCQRLFLFSVQNLPLLLYISIIEYSIVLIV
jgi:hypothetical protein